MTLRSIDTAPADASRVVELPIRIAVVIPALNEAGNIGRLIAETYEMVPAVN